MATPAAASTEFWCDRLGFAIAYRRPEEAFAYLERPEGAQIMLTERSGKWETAPLERLDRRLCARHDRLNPPADALKLICFIWVSSVGSLLPKLVGPGHGKERPGRRLFWAFGLSLLPTILVCAVAITPAHCEPSTADMTIIVGAASKTEGACTRAARDYISRERLHAPRGYYLKAGCLEEKPAKSPRPIINTGVGAFAHISRKVRPRIRTGPPCLHDLPVELM